MGELLVINIRDNARIQGAANFLKKKVARPWFHLRKSVLSLLTYYISTRIIRADGTADKLLAKRRVFLAKTLGNGRNELKISSRTVVTGHGDTRLKILSRTDLVRPPKCSS